MSYLAITDIKMFLHKKLSKLYNTSSMLGKMLTQERKLRSLCLNETTHMAKIYYIYFQIYFLTYFSVLLKLLVKYILYKIYKYIYGAMHLLHWRLQSLAAKYTIGLYHPSNLICLRVNKTGIQCGGSTADVGACGRHP